MSECSVTFTPQNITVKVKRGATLLEAASDAHITLNNLCGGDGICGRCRMIVKKGEVSGRVSGKLTRAEIKKGYVLACLSTIENDLTVEIPEETLAKEKVLADRDAERFRYFEKEVTYHKYKPAPLVSKLYLDLDKPTLANNTADHQIVCDAVKKKLKYRSMQMGLKIMKSVPAILRANDYRVTVD